MSTTFINWLDGILLGDGHISPGGRLCLSQCVQNQSWVVQIENALTQAEISWGRTRQAGGAVLIRGREYMRSASVGVRTRKSPLFVEQRRRWYPDDQKRVPLDVSVAPEAIAQWWWGDGTVGGGGYRAYFCTDGFLETDVSRLIQLLKDRHGWSPHHTKRNRILLCRAFDRASLRSMLSAPPACFVHKLKLCTQDRRRLHGPEVVQAVRQRRGAGQSYQEIGDALGISKSTVSSICVREGVSGYSSRQPGQTTHDRTATR